MRLQDALAMIPAERRVTLREARGIVIDPRKRIDEVEQIARALVARTDLRQSRFPSDARHLLWRLAQAGGTLGSGASDPGASVLCELGIAYSSRWLASTRGAGRTGKRLAVDALVLPSAFVVQVPQGPGDDPRSLRACLCAIDNEIVTAMVSTVVGKPLAVTGPLALQEVWEVLTMPGEIAARVAQLPPAEARLLDAIERAGGEVTTNELLALDQTPGLYRTAAGVAIPKRGAPYMLQRRGLLYQLGVERFVLATEVAAVVGAQRAVERAERRAQLRTTLAGDDFAPRRARYGRDPSLAAAAALVMFRSAEVSVRDDTGIPRSAVRRVAERIGETEESMALVTALLRASGLLRLIAPSAAVPGSMAQVSVGELGELLRMAYRRGGAWDETLREGETARVPGIERLPSAAPVLRSMTIEALEQLATEVWVPVEAIVRYVMDDPRAGGAARLLDRARRERSGVHREHVEEALRTMVVESMPAVGMVDVSEDSTAVRWNARARRTARTVQATTVARTQVEVPATCAVASLVALADFAELDHVRVDDGVIALSVGAGSDVRARAHGLDGAAVSERLAAVGVQATDFPATEQLVIALGETRTVGYVRAGAALFVDDPSVRATVLGDPVVRRAVLGVSTGAVALLVADADIERVVARLARLGIKLAEATMPAQIAEGAESKPQSAVEAAPVVGGDAHGEVAEESAREGSESGDGGSASTG